jgi:hypothetical protein
MADLREWLEDRGHGYIVTGSEEGSGSAFQEHVSDMSTLRVAVQCFVISQPEAGERS